jgi:hypothetical protein
MSSRGTINMKQNLAKKLKTELENWSMKHNLFYIKLIFTIERLEKRIEELENKLESK